MTQWIAKYRNHLMTVAGILIGVGYLTEAMGSINWQAACFISATLLAGIPIFIRAVQAVRMRVFGIELLVTVAVAGALVIHEYSESAIVTFLFLFGAFLEMRTLEKTRSSLKKLMDLAPREATVRRDGSLFTIDAQDVKEGDCVVLRPGGKIPVDGIVLSGSAYINEAMITGEPVPARKEKNDRVFSGTIAEDGYLEIQAERVGEDTTFSKILELVEEAQESKSKAQKFLDRFSAVYTPVIVILAVVVLALTRDLHMAITFLVIACPGALVIGAPVSNVAGIGNGARNGVLIKGGEIMDQFSRVDTLIFDKTGTLTRGKPEIAEIITFGTVLEDDLLRMTAQLELQSEHHLARTIVREAQTRGMDISGQSQNVEIIKGKGIIGNNEGHVLAAGSKAILEKMDVILEKSTVEAVRQKEMEGNSTVFVILDGILQGVFFISDQIREDAEEAIRVLKKEGIRKIIMLTGDNEHTAALIAGKLHLDEFHGGLLPEDKAAFVKEIRKSGARVAMVGDGINDAPAIAEADVGISMGETGTDISMETADIVLMADKLSHLIHAKRLAVTTVRNMKQNIFIAVATVILLLVGVVTDQVHLAAGMFVHEASILLVILNAMRLIGFGNKKNAGSKRGKKQ